MQFLHLICLKIEKTFNIFTNDEKDFYNNFKQLENMRKAHVQKMSQDQQGQSSDGTTQDDDISLIVKLIPISIQNNLVILVIKSILQVACILLSFHYFLSNSPKQYHYTNFFNSAIRSLLENNTGSLSALSIITSIVTVFNITFYNLLQAKLLNTILVVNQFINSLLPILIELNILISAILLIDNEQSPWVKLANLVIVMSIAIFTDAFMQCISQPTTLLHSYEPLFILCLRVCTSFLLLVSIISFISQLSQVILALVSILFLIIIFTYYMSVGYRTYRHTASKMTLLITISFFSSACVAILIYESAIASIFNLIFTIIVVFCAYMLISKNKSDFSFNQVKFELKDVQMFLTTFQDLVENSNFDEKCFLIGLLQVHKSYKCENIYCYSHKQTVYCTAVEADVEIESVLRYDSVIRYFVKCLFEELISKDPLNYEILLSYCEFTYHQMKNILPLAVYLERLQRVRLSLYQQMRLYNLKKGLRDNMQKSNYTNLNSKLPFQKVIEYDEVCQDIMKNNFELIERNIALWQQLQQPKVCMENVLKTIVEIQKKSQYLKAYWQKFEKYLGTWSMLRQLFAFYSLFADNHAKKQKKVKKLQKILLGQQQEGKLNEIISQDDVFGKNSLIIHTFLNCNKMFIKKASKSIRPILGYSPQEVVLCDLEIIMPAYFREHHRKKFEHWMDQGFVKLERFQTGVSIFCTDKTDCLHSVTKTFKLFITNESEVQFVCLLKQQSHKKSNAVVCNKKLEIQQTTKDFNQTFKLDPQELFLKASSGVKISQYIPNIQQFMKEYNKSQSKDIKQAEFSFKIKNVPCQLIIERLQYGNDDFLIQIKSNSEEKHWKEHDARQIQFQDSSQNINMSALNKLNHQQSIPSNIFMKDQSMTPNEAMKEMRWIKYLLHGFFTTLLIIFMVMMTMTNKNYLTLKEYIQEYQIFLKVFKSPFILGIKYHLQQCQISKEDFLIEKSTDQFIEYTQMNHFLKTLFNGLFGQQSQLEDSYDLIDNDKLDVFFLLSSSIMSLRNSSRNLDGIDFKNFNQLIIPYFYDIGDEAKDKIYQTFRKLYQEISVPNVILLEAQSVLFALIVVLLTVNFVNLCKKLREIFKILVNVDTNQLATIKNYWYEIEYRYAQFQPKNMNKKRQLIADNRYLSKKQIQPGKRLKRSQKFIYATAIFSLSIKFFITAALDVYISSQISSLQAFGNTSQSFYDFYPSNIAVGYGIMQRYYQENTLNLSQPMIDTYQEAITDTYQITNFSYMPSSMDPDSQFYTAIKNYYYGNPCTYNPSLLAEFNTTVKECILNGQLSQGIVSYQMNIGPIIQKYLSGKTHFSAEQIANITKWIFVVDAFMEDIVGIWNDEFTQKTERVRVVSVTLYLVMSGLIIIVHYTIAHRSFILALADYFEQFTKAYVCLMTFNSIQKNKIVKCELISLGFIRQ